MISVSGYESSYEKYNASICNRRSKDNMLAIHGDVKTARLSVCSASFKPNPFSMLKNENGSKQLIEDSSQSLRTMAGLEDALSVFKIKT
jgi:hypothetical protein